ncbi:hypothetical protein L195_g024797 [Trifolium pratense]|uniref:HTH OST-type domain-containing protein n=2 Tax=Trifolium pratense TaxID=57577 RepID=A0A2K3NEP7_TRIPR|nr:hypothetical protein L195_g024797 [Trifolium pratense]
MSMDSMEQKGKNIAESNESIDGPISILWDIENCSVPSDVRPEDVAGNIRKALKVHPVIAGAVMMFAAYGDFNAFPRRLREGCHRTGVKLMDVPNGRKDAADKAILLDMLLFALDNPAPASIMLISGDVDFAPALHTLGQRGYTIILVIPAGVGVSSALCNAGKFVWDWPVVARGEGFVPPSKALAPPRGGSVDPSRYLMGCHINDSTGGQNEEEAIVYSGMPQSYSNSREFSVVSQSLSEYNSPHVSYLPTSLRSYSLPSGLNDVAGESVPSSDNTECQTWVQPGDLNGLKGQIIRLVELSGGCLPLVQVPAEYQKIYGKPLFLSEYGAFKLVDLFKKMDDAISVEGKGAHRFVYLRSREDGSGVPPLFLAKKDKKGKKALEENANAVIGGCSSYENELSNKLSLLKYLSSSDSGQIFMFDIDELLGIEY